MTPPPANGGGGGGGDVVDLYGFPLPSLDAASLAARAACDVAAARRAPRWEGVAAGGELPPADELKAMARKGIPPSLRPRVWAAASGASARAAEHGPDYFRAVCEMGATVSECARQIDLDLPRTFPNNAAVAAALPSLRRVLLAFAAHAPATGYCQSMNFVAALLLLAVARGAPRPHAPPHAGPPTPADEEAAFWLLVALADDDGGILYRGLYGAELAGCHVELRCLEALVASKLPKVAARLARAGADMSLLATDWFLCLFCTALPAETTARVWDALFVEGPKVMFRVGLALLKRAQRPLLAAPPNAGAIMHAARAAAAAEHDRDGLMKAAFDGLGGLPMARIEGARARGQAAVDRELAARRRPRPA